LRLDVADFDWDHPGPASWTHYRMATTPANAAGRATEVEVCRLPTDDAAAAQVTAVRTNAGEQKLILWREADTP
jgi:hypothetical protein